MCGKCNLALFEVHALREEGDQCTFQASAGSADFNPRPPRGGRRIALGLTQAQLAISIHALREEGDCIMLYFPYQLSDFNPRPPRGGRLGHLLKGYSAQPFQSTPSVRRATVVLFLPHFISIFQSTPSVRRVTASATEFSFSFAISIHALREEGDVSSITDFFINIISIHALREEGDSKNL